MNPFHVSFFAMLIYRWHLGYCDYDYLPTRRGFDSFYGFYLGSQDYYKHTRMPQSEQIYQFFQFILKYVKIILGLSHYILI